MIRAPRLMLEQASPLQNAEVLILPMRFSRILNASGLTSHNRRGSGVNPLAMLKISVTTLAR